MPVQKGARYFCDKLELENFDKDGTQNLPLLFYDKVVRIIYVCPCWKQTYNLIPFTISSVLSWVIAQDLQTVNALL